MKMGEVTISQNYMLEGSFIPTFPQLSTIASIYSGFGTVSISQPPFYFGSLVESGIRVRRVPSWKLRMSSTGPIQFAQQFVDPGVEDLEEAIIRTFETIKEIECLSDKVLVPASYDEHHMDLHTSGDKKSVEDALAVIKGNRAAIAKAVNEAMPEVDMWVQDRRWFATDVERLGKGVYSARVTFGFHGDLREKKKRKRA